MVKKIGKWQRVSFKYVHINPFYKIRQDNVIQPNGQKGKYNVVECRDAVYVIALDNNANIYLVNLHRYTNNNSSIELPAGGIDKKDSNPLQSAKRELQEETGLTAKSWQLLGKLHPANGIVSASSYVYLAKDLKQTQKNQQKEEGISKVTKVNIKETILMIKNGKITDSETISALTLAFLELESIK